MVLTTAKIKEKFLYLYRLAVSIVQIGVLENTLELYVQRLTL